MTDTTELTPRPPRAGRRWWSTALVLVVLAVIAVVLFVLVRGASLFVYEADEALEQREELGDDRFRLIGSPIEGSIIDGEFEGRTAVYFSVQFEDAVVDVVHTGSDPTALFQPGVPVFLEGQWTVTSTDDVEFAEGANDGWYFASDTLRVKHDEDYRNENDERISDAEQGGQ
ncbi:MAG: cytochrome c maturation protein CcmE [Acidimicrobiales bacterium]